MRKICILPILILILSSCTPSDKSNEIKVLSAKVDSLSAKVDKLSGQNSVMEEEFTWIENELGALNKSKTAKPETAAVVPSAKTSEKAAPAKAVPAKAVVDWQCIAITNAGTRCSRPALKGSKYCWQHKKTYEPDIIDQKTPPSESVTGDPKK